MLSGPAAAVLCCALRLQKSNQLLKAADVVSKVYERNQQWRQNMMRELQTPCRLWSFTVSQPVCTAAYVPLFQQLN
jgi:hypothetical protein